MSKKHSKLDSLFSSMQSDEQLRSPNVEDISDVSCISFRGDQLFHPKSTLSTPPGLAPISFHSAEPAKIKYHSHSKFASPPPGFPPNSGPNNENMQSASILELSDHMKSLLSKKDTSFKEPCTPPDISSDSISTGIINECLNDLLGRKNLHNGLELPTSDKPYWLMTDREVRHIWRISMTPVISALCKSPCNVNSSRDHFLAENPNLFLDKEGRIEYPRDYTGDDFYFAQYAPKKSADKKELPKVAGNLLFPSTATTRFGRRTFREPTISNEVHLKSILPHVPKLASRGEKVVDGALGKISLNSLRRPKQSISIDSMPVSSPPKLVENNSFSKMVSLSMAEKVYQALNKSAGEKDLLALIADPHSLLSLVQTPKGKRSIPLIISALSSPTSVECSSSLFSIFQTILCNLCLFLSSMSTSHLQHENYIKDDNAAVVESILTPFVSFLTQLSVPEMFELCKKIAIQPGLSQIISHSKAGGANFHAFEDTWNQVAESLFNSLCISFPAMLSPSSSPFPQTEDDLFYAWQFLALLSAHISSANCHTLVNVLRDPILSAANSGSPEPIRNVNLLLNMIGLDASQLAQKSK
ncbi:DNA topoisomerase 2-associated protein Pat1 [Mitosporidium daphniae]|uniref:DNA topoisomerase 2-associated protein Pat1 n=1 Tax=Mitosporidium daphniae TaxID=1485682 RepID=A0A098VNH0_9MICR|nr:DNA topoisomerase 2-associated protein Pat1 [Mitosporidium daphniae]KGG50324.1 DNA topoisomerase 2-associated protein Pat1 [Mitosporidium daphniae]|eukprot:XP_013236751.1 DNA topoisomerase 2-associated protein Pat1 [Mitosporidium daphniae]